MVRFVRKPLLLISSGRPPNVLEMADMGTVETRFMGMLIALALLSMRKPES